MTFNPELLVLARRSRGLTQDRLADLASLTHTAISRCEAGLLELSEDSIARLASALGYPKEFFYRSATLWGLAGGAVFHRKQQSLPAKTLYRAHACAEVRRLEIMTLLESLRELPPSVPEYHVELFDDDPAKIARSVRTAMNIPPGPISNLTETLERNGCVIVGHDFGARQLDGFSQRSQYPPVFMHLNNDLPPDRWRWTLAHELGHAVMHFEPIAPLRQVEDQANLFASEFLTPAHEIRPALDDLSFQKLGALKREWKVSMQALIMRAAQLNAITGRQRQSMFARLSAAGYRLREPATLDPPVERPSWMKRLSRRHLDDLDFGVVELSALVHLTEREFSRHYLDDIWSDVDSILENF